MKKTLFFALLAAPLMLAIPVADAGETKFGKVAPRAEHSRHYGHQDRNYRRYDRYRQNRNYRTNRNYTRYRYRPNSDYVYRPLPSRYSYDRHYNRYRYDPYRHYYRQRGDGVRITPHGLTIFLDFDD